VRIGSRRVRLRQSDLNAFIAQGERPGATAPEPPNRRGRLGATLADASNAVTRGNDAEFAAALLALADAARDLAAALGKK